MSPIAHVSQAGPPVGWAAGEMHDSDDDDIDLLRLDAVHSIWGSLTTGRKRRSSGRSPPTPPDSRTGRTRPRDARLGDLRVAGQLAAPQGHTDPRAGAHAKPPRVARMDGDLEVRRELQEPLDPARQHPAVPVIEE